jgi:hypothetical protein
MEPRFATCWLRFSEPKQWGEKSAEAVAVGFE